MGFNIAGILTSNQLDKKEKLETLLETKLQYTQDIDGETATLTKNSAEFDVYTNNKGSIVFFEMGEIYDFSNTKGECIQFMISDVSDTYYFEKYKDGQLVRKLIVSQGEIAEDEGEGVIDKDDDFMDKVLELSNKLLEVDPFDMNFKRFKQIQKDSEDSSKIGSKGKSINISSATRAMNVEPDKDQIKKLDELTKKTNRIKYGLVLVIIVLAKLTLHLFQTNHWIIGSILVVVELILIFFAFSISNTGAYKNGLIVPAIIIETNPIKIIALADMRTEEQQEKLIWGCKKVTLKNLPNHKIEIGEKVPCVSLFSMASKGYRINFEPRPISWGYKNPDYIPKVIDVITNSDEDYHNYANEWEILENLVDTMKKTEKENKVLFFDENLNETTLEKLSQE